MRKPRMVLLSDTTWRMAKHAAAENDLSVTDWIQALIVTERYERQERERRRHAQLDADLVLGADRCTCGEFTGATCRRHNSTWTMA